LKAELAPRGELRAALFTGNPVIASKNRETGELSGTAFMLGRALAADAGVGFAPIEYTTIARLMDDAKTGAWDVAVLAIDPARRAVIDYAPPYVVADITYLVRPGSPIASVAEAHRPGVRVTAARGAATALLPQRPPKHAQLTPSSSAPSTRPACAACRRHRPPGRGRQRVRPNPVIDVHTHVVPERWDDWSARHAVGPWPAIAHHDDGTASLIVGGKPVRALETG